MLDIVRSNTDETQSGAARVFTFFRDRLLSGALKAGDRLLAERPQVAGIAVPGMPIGSPGMEVPGRAADRYHVMTFDRTGRTTVFATR